MEIVFKILWTDFAINQLKDIFDYHLIKASPNIAQRLVQKKETPTVLDLFLSDKYKTKNGVQVSVYKDSNTLEIYKIAENGDNLKLNNSRLLNLKNENLVIIKKPHVFNGNYLIENWIQPFPKN